MKEKRQWCLIARTDSDVKKAENIYITMQQLNTKYDCNIYISPSISQSIIDKLTVPYIKILKDDLDLINSDNYMLYLLSFNNYHRSFLLNIDKIPLINIDFLFDLDIRDNNCWFKDKDNNYILSVFYCESDPIIYKIIKSQYQLKIDLIKKTFFDTNGIISLYDDTYNICTKENII